MPEFESPNFLNAPLIEVALSVQFQSLPQFTSAYAGLFWEKIRSEFPIAQDQPPLQMISELFGGNRPNAGFIGVGFQFGAPQNRNWFMSPDGGAMIQVQNNRFVFNWRKTTELSQYPRYEAVRGNFSKYLEMFKSFISENNLGSFVPDLYEVHYVNQWPLEDGKTFGEVIGSWMRLFPEPITSLALEQASLSTQYIVQGETDKPVGRLYVNVTPVINQIGKHGVNLDLICRIIPLDLGPRFELSPLDLAREKIVTTFSQITSDSAHQFWRGESQNS